jgi:hypothetical protein
MRCQYCPSPSYYLIYRTPHDTNPLYLCEPCGDQFLDTQPQPDYTTPMTETEPENCEHFHTMNIGSGWECVTCGLLLDRSNDQLLKAENARLRQALQDAGVPAGLVDAIAKGTS